MQEERRKIKEELRKAMEEYWKAMREHRKAMEEYWTAMGEHRRTMELVSEGEDGRVRLKWLPSPLDRLIVLANGAGLWRLPESRKVTDEIKDAERRARALKVGLEFCPPKAAQARKEANAILAMVNPLHKFSRTASFYAFQARFGAEEERAGYYRAMIWSRILEQLENDIRSVDSPARDDVPTPAILFLYLFGYVDRGSTKNYNSGALEFRDIYVSVILFQGSYVWIKFRDFSTRRTSYVREDGTETVRYEGRFKLPGGKKYLHAGTYENREDAKVGGRIAEFYSGKNTEGKVDLQDGFSFDIPPVAESETPKLSFEVSSLSDEQASKYKRNWIKVNTHEVFKLYKEQRARWTESLINDLVVTPPVQESINQQPNIQEGQPGGAARIAEEQQQHYQNLWQLIENFPEEQLEARLNRIVEEQQQQNLQEEQPGAGWDRIADEQQQHYQTLPAIENLQEEQLEAGWNRIVEEPQHYCAILQQLEQRNMENLELERKYLESQRENFELRQTIERMDQRDLENLGQKT